MQRALIQYRDPKNAGLVREALEKARPTELIGYGRRVWFRSCAPGRTGGAGRAGQKTRGVREDRVRREEGRGPEAVRAGEARKTYLRQNAQTFMKTKIPAKIG